MGMNDLNRMTPDMMGGGTVAIPAISGIGAAIAGSPWMALKKENGLTPEQEKILADKFDEYRRGGRPRDEELIREFEDELKAIEEEQRAQEKLSPEKIKEISDRFEKERQDRLNQDPDYLEHKIRLNEFTKKIDQFEPKQKTMPPWFLMDTRKRQ